MFDHGDTHICHTIDIQDDFICESDEHFFSDLLYVNGMQPIIISPSTAQVVIDDSDEQECKYTSSSGSKVM